MIPMFSYLKINRLRLLSVIFGRLLRLRDVENWKNGLIQLSTTFGTVVKWQMDPKGLDNLHFYIQFQ